MRVFVSLNPDPATKAWIGEAQRRVRAGLARFERDIRWVRPEDVHLTLAFLGEVEDAVPLQEALAACDFKAFEVQIGGWGCFPSSRHPKVLWLGIADPSDALEGLQASVASALSIPVGPERPAFQPHLTLARFRPGRYRYRIGAALKAIAPHGHSFSWSIRSFCLMESRLGAARAEHTVIREFSA